MTMADDLLTPEEAQRYSRHLVLPEIGKRGQTKLKASSVLVVGAGGLGSPVLTYLAAAGVGHLGIVDFDNVDYSNLQRQTIHGTADVGQPKVASATQTITNINPNVKVTQYPFALTRDNAMSIAEGYDLIIDGTDNFATRYLVNDVCVLLKKPNCYGSIFRFEGQASVFGHEGGPCYRCLYPTPPAPGLVPNCAEGGVLGVLPSIIGTIQATEAIKILLGIGQTLSGRLLLYDALDMSFREMKVRRSPDCPICGEHPSIDSLMDYPAWCGTKIGEPTNGEPQSAWDISPQEAQKRMQSDPTIRLLDVRQPDEYDICHLGGQLVPLGELADRLGQLNPEDSYIVHCKLGKRSAKAVELLRNHGFRNVFNLRGGIAAWSEQIDPNIPKY
jgi:sulfur-carrier protein adenylyltransferase/sulfurtransferase